MKQRATRELFEYWNVLRGARPAPRREDIDPGAIRACLAGTFILTFDPDRGHPFRIAGTAICAMFGRELAGTGFDRLWCAENRPIIADLIRAVAVDTEGLVAGVTGRNAVGDGVDLEMILLPLTCPDPGAGRLLGAFAVVSAPYWLGVKPLQALQVGDWRFTGAGGVPEKFAAAADGRLRGPGFVIYPAAR